MKRQRGSGSIYKQAGSDVWWLSYYRHGRQLRVSSGTTGEVKARRELNRRVGQVANEIHPDPGVERVKLDELAEGLLRDYKINGRKSLDDVEARWRLHLLPAFGGMRAAYVTSKHLANYIDQRSRKTPAMPPSTANSRHSSACSPWATRRHRQRCCISPPSPI